MNQLNRNWSSQRANRSTRSLLTVSLSVLFAIGCGNGGDGATQKGWVAAEDSQSAQPPTFADFRRQSQAFSAGQPDGYIIESHIQIYNEESLRTYYDAVYGQSVEKSVGWTIGGVLGSRPAPTNIRFCFASGWGASVGGGFTAPDKATVVSQTLTGMQHWQGVAKISFVYRSDLDGVGCTTANIANGSLGVDFVVRPYANDCTASGAFPWLAASDQALKVPQCGLPGLLADHELGHVLGLRHEMEHSQNDCGLIPNAGDTDLTSYDRNSVMFYTNCTGDAASRRISMLDGVGIRKIYGPPSWWWSGLL